MLLVLFGFLTQAPVEFVQHNGDRYRVDMSSVTMTQEDFLIGVEGVAHVTVYGPGDRVFYMELGCGNDGGDDDHPPIFASGLFKIKDFAGRYLKTTDFSFPKEIFMHVCDVGRRRNPP